MKNLKNMIAIVALVSVLGVGNAFANDLTKDGSSSNQQYSQTAGSWFDNLFNYFKGYFKNDDRGVAGDKGTVQPKAEKLAVNHNETLVRDVD